MICKKNKLTHTRKKTNSHSPDISINIYTNANLEYNNVYIQKTRWRIHYYLINERVWWAQRLLFRNCAKRHSQLKLRFLMHIYTFTQKKVLILVQIKVKCINLCTSQHTVTLQSKGKNICRHRTIYTHIYIQ